VRSSGWSADHAEMKTQPDFSSAALTRFLLDPVQYDLQVLEPPSTR